MVIQPPPLDDNFDSDIEDAVAIQQPLEISWLNFFHNGQLLRVCISTLAGCKIRDDVRSVSADLDTLKSKEISDLFIFSPQHELVSCGVSKMLFQCEDKGFVVHYYPFSDGNLLSIPETVKILEEMMQCLKAGNRICLQSPNGIGKSCMMAGLLGMYLNNSLTFEETRALLCRTKGASAIQTIKEYNFLSEFRKNLEEHNLCLVKE